MSDQTVRDLIAVAINDRFSPVKGRDPSWYNAEADYIVAALAAHGLTITDTPTDEWEWGFSLNHRDGTPYIEGPVTERYARGSGRPIVRRRPADPWKEAPGGV